MGAAGEAQQPQQQRSPITTHVLDTSVGRPAAGVAVALARRCPGSGQAWADVAAGVTNRDGRVGDLLPPSGSVEPGLYRRAHMWRTARGLALVQAHLASTLDMG